MTEQQFEVKGTFRIDGNWLPYTKNVAAPNEKLASERIYTVIGSKHRLKRNYIRIDTVTLIEE